MEKYFIAVIAEYRIFSIGSFNKFISKFINSTEFGQYKNTVDTEIN